MNDGGGGGLVPQHLFRRGGKGLCKWCRGYNGGMRMREWNEEDRREEE